MITPEELHAIAVSEAGDTSHAGCGLDCSRKRLAELALGYLESRMEVAALRGHESSPNCHTLTLVRGETAQPETIKICPSGTETP